VSKVLRILSIVFASLSLISLLQHVTDVGLVSIFSDLVTYYRDASQQFFIVFELLFSINLPQEIKDLWLLSFIGAGAYIKTPDIQNSRLLRNFEISQENKYWKPILFLLMGSSFIGIGILLTAFNPSIYTDSMSEESQVLMRNSAKNSFVVVIGACTFFVLNAYAPSV
jgi:hypothetical protein